MTTILVTDGRPAAAGVRLVSADERFDVIGQAYSGPEVLPLVGRSAPRLVVLDLDLTGFDGLGCVREIVALNPSVKVVVVSASADPDVMSAAFHRGACGYVVPGRDARELSTAIWQAASAAGYEA